MLRTKLGADGFERAGFRAEDRRAVELAEDQRAQAPRVARAHHLAVGQGHEAQPPSSWRRASMKRSSMGGCAASGL